jgi:hypothetical protein
MKVLPERDGTHRGFPSRLKNEMEAMARTRRMSIPSNTLSIAI